MTVNATPVHINTHIPCKDHVNIKLKNDFLISINLLSPPDRCTLVNRNVPNLTAHNTIIDINISDLKSPIPPII